MSNVLALERVRSCAGCGTELAPALLACPACGRLVHRDRLSALAADASAASAAGEHERAMALWREALVLLPEATKQHATIAERIAAESAAIDSAVLAEARKGPPPSSFWGKLLAPLGTVGLLIWKLKIVLFALLTKGKLLLLGLTKIGTLVTMLASFGLYWTLWGWPYAAAIVLSIYIHEIGHVAALRRRGLPASAPLFIPGVGAFVRMHEHAATPREDAEVGLAGPWWGLGSAAIALIVFAWLRSPFWLAIAHTVGWITLFNLTPVWQLDGSRGFHALSRTQRWVMVAVIASVWAVSREGLLVLLGLAAAWKAFEKQPERPNDWRIFAHYTALLVIAAALTTIRSR
jgi:Zn-dependent protease